MQDLITERFSKEGIPKVVELTSVIEKLEKELQEEK